MKNTVALATLAAGFSQVTAFGGFESALSFNCPDNTDNECGWSGSLSGGFDWSGLGLGSFSSYGGCSWSGFSCEDSFLGKRDLTRRSGFQEKCAAGSASHDQGSCPSFSSDSDSNKFSISTFQISTEFDCELEFHYGMGDGSVCKQRSFCSHSGSTISNSQCGGAKNVTVVYPSQPSMPKETCSFGVHSISFDCSSASSTVPPASQTNYIPTSPAEVSTTATATGSFSLPSGPASSIPTGVQTATITEATTLTHVSSYLSTSTVYTTSVSTVISCAPTVTNCPAGSGSPTVVTATVAVTTTVCPVEETHTTVITPSGTSIVTYTPVAPASSVPAETTSGAEAVSATSSAPAAGETLPCPGLVPSCLNSWLWSVGCKDNTDASCYCADAKFVNNVYSCLYAYGEEDSLISEAISYVQGICAPYVGSNPAVVTGAASVTTYLTATATSTLASAVYTTVEVTATTVVPCTYGESGSATGAATAASSSTIIITTAMTVPQVAFTTVTSAGSSGAVIVNAPTPIAQVSTPAAVSGTIIGGNQPTSAVLATPAPTTLATASPVGTGSYTTSKPSSTFVPVSAGAGRATGSSLIIAAAAALALVAL